MREMLKVIMKIVIKFKLMTKMVVKNCPYDNVNVKKSQICIFWLRERVFLTREPVLSNALFKCQLCWPLASSEIKFYNHYEGRISFN
jgi:hypothetical protein